jgi:hypothetical protein
MNDQARARAPAPCSPACRRAGRRRARPRRRPAPTRRRPSRPIRTSGASGGGAASPDFLLRRSVGQLGRKSDTTLGIAGLHFKICTFSGPARISSSCQRARPTPGTGSGVDGRTETRQRVSRRSAARNRSPRSAAASGEWRCRSRRSFRRRAAGAARPSSKAGRSRQRRRRGRHGEDLPRNRRERSFRRRLRHRSPVGGRPAWAIAGAKRSGRVTHHSTLPTVRAAIPAANSAAAAPSIAPLPPPATSCRPPKANPPPGAFDARAISFQCENASSILDFWAPRSVRKL